MVAVSAQEAATAADSIVVHQVQVHPDLPEVSEDKFNKKRI